MASLRDRIAAFAAFLDGTPSGKPATGSADDKKLGDHVALARAALVGVGADLDRLDGVAVRIGGAIGGTPGTPTIPALAELSAQIVALGGEATTPVQAPFTDDFARIDQDGLGNGWTGALSGLRIVDNRVGVQTEAKAGTALNTSVAVRPEVVGGPQFAGVDVSVVDPAAGVPHPQVMVHGSMSGTAFLGYMGRYSGSRTWQIYKFESSGPTLLKEVSINADPAAPYRLRLEDDGDGGLVLLKNGTPVATADDPNPIAGGAPGFGVRYVVTAASRTQRVDNFSGGANGAGQPVGTRVRATYYLTPAQASALPLAQRSADVLYVEVPS